MGDSQLRRGEGQNGDLWRQGGELFGKIACGASAAYFGAGRIGILVASQLCGEIFGDLAPRIPQLFGQPSDRPRRQPRFRQPRGQSRFAPPPQFRRPTTPQELFTLQQMGYDPLGQIPGIPSQPGQGPSDSGGQGPSDIGGQGPGGFGGQGPGGFGGQGPSGFGGQGPNDFGNQPGLPPPTGQPPSVPPTQPFPTIPTIPPTIPPGATVNPQPGDPYGYFVPGRGIIRFPGTIIAAPGPNDSLIGFIGRGIGTLGPFIGFPPGS